MKNANSKWSLHKSVKINSNTFYNILAACLPLQPVVVYAIPAQMNNISQFDVGTHVYMYVKSMT